jgi:hypothetical protein
VESGWVCSCEPPSAPHATAAVSERAHALPGDEHQRSAHPLALPPLLPRRARSACAAGRQAPPTSSLPHVHASWRRHASCPSRTGHSRPDDDDDDDDGFAHSRAWQAAGGASGVGTPAAAAHRAAAWAPTLQLRLQRAAASSGEGGGCAGDVSLMCETRSGTHTPARPTASPAITMIVDFTVRGTSIGV